MLVWVRETAELNTTRGYGRSSPKVRLKRPCSISLTRCLCPRAAVVRASCPKPAPLPASPQTLARIPTQTTSAPTPALRSSIPLPFPEGFLFTPTPFNLHMPPQGRLPSNSCIGRAPPRFPEPTSAFNNGAHPIQHSRF